MKRVVFIVLIAAFFWSCASTSDVIGDEEFFELVKTGSPKEVKKALENDANVNARNESGSTPLMYVCETSDSPEMLQVLIDAGADVQATNELGTDAFSLLNLMMRSSILMPTGICIS